jgi:tRNA threonylcarbamoyladenosine biosynthesis protein TsaE
MNTDLITTYFLPREEDMLAFGACLAKAIDQDAVIYLYGELGTGKTTLTRGFLRGLGYEDKVKSPTYTLVEPYLVKGKKIFHFDLYRLLDSQELEHMGIRDYFSPGAICLIEWPDKGFPLLSAADLACYIVFKEQEQAGDIKKNGDKEQGREIRLQALSSKGENILKRIKNSF